MLDAIKPGQTIRCTITSEPRREDTRQTILRLMRRDPGIARGLRRAQKRRRANMNSYIRGGKMWHARERVGKIAKVQADAQWTMTYTPDLASDFRAVEKHVKVESA